MAEAAEHWQVDRNTIARIRVMAKEGALRRWPTRVPGCGPKSATTSWSQPEPTPPVVHLLPSRNSGSSQFSG